MALTGIRQIYSGFFKEFTKGATEDFLPAGSLQKHPLHTLETGGKLLVRYFQRSGEKSYEEVAGHYPVIVIQDFTPTINLLYNINRV